MKYLNPNYFAESIIKVIDLLYDRFGITDNILVRILLTIALFTAVGISLGLFGVVVLG